MSWWVVFATLAFADSSGSATLISSFSFNQLSTNTPQISPIPSDSYSGGNSAATVTNYSFDAPGFASGVGTAVNSDTANPNTATPGAALSLQTTGTTNDGAMIVFHLSTSKFTNVNFSFATQRVGKGFVTETIYYSPTRSGSLTQSNYTFTPDDSFTAESFAIAGLDNKTDIQIGILFNGIAQSPKSGSSGADVIDNFEVYGTPPTPELNSSLLFGAALSTMTLLRRSPAMAR